MIASLLGGRISDWAAVKYGPAPEARMLVNYILSLSIAVPGFLIYLWTLEKGTPLAGMLFLQRTSFNAPYLVLSLRFQMKY